MCDRRQLIYDPRKQKWYHCADDALRTLKKRNGHRARPLPAQRARPRAAIVRAPPPPTPTVVQGPRGRGRPAKELGANELPAGARRITNPREIDALEFMFSVDNDALHEKRMFISPRGVYVYLDKNGKRRTPQLKRNPSIEIAVPPRASTARAQGRVVATETRLAKRGQKASQQMQRATLLASQARHQELVKLARQKNIDRLLEIGKAQMQQRAEQDSVERILRENEAALIRELNKKQQKNNKKQHKQDARASKKKSPKRKSAQSAGENRGIPVDRETFVDHSLGVERGRIITGWDETTEGELRSADNWFQRFDKLSNGLSKFYTPKIGVKTILQAAHNGWSENNTRHLIAKGVMMQQLGRIDRPTVNKLQASGQSIEKIFHIMPTCDSESEYDGSPKLDLYSDSDSD